jgi:AcrR family transcriptional regulator
MGSESQAIRSGPQRRTRAALLSATAALLRAGRLPSVAEAAEAADVSRRTAYRYFPTQEQLLTEAALETLRPGIEASFASITDDPEARLDAAVRAMQDQAAANERLLRTMIRLTVERGAPAPSPDGSPPIRGNRRIDWIESAVSPVRTMLGKAAFAQLVSALSLCVGAEALIILRDIRNLDTSAAADICAWSARAILRAALAEAKIGSATSGRKRERHEKYRA